MASGPRLIPILPKSKSVVDDAALKKQMESVLKLAILEFQREIAKYPPRQPHITRDRTGNYGRGWSADARITDKGFESQTIENLVVYANRVSRTEPYKSYGWPQLLDTAEKVIKRLKQQGKLQFKGL